MSLNKQTIAKSSHLVSRHSSKHIKSGNKSLLKTVLKNRTNRSAMDMTMSTKHCLNVAPFAARVVAYVDCYLTTYLSAQELDPEDTEQALALTQLLEAIQSVTSHERPVVAMHLNERSQMIRYTDEWINDLYQAANHVWQSTHNPPPHIAVIVESIQHFRQSLPLFGLTVVAEAYDSSPPESASESASNASPTPSPDSSGQTNQSSLTGAPDGPSQS